MVLLQPWVPATRVLPSLHGRRCRHRPPIHHNLGRARARLRLLHQQRPQGGALMKALDHLRAADEALAAALSDLEVE